VSELQQPESLDRLAAEPYRILSVDGGGIRGLYAAVLLELLEQEAPGFLSSVDLFAGTSTGGIIALGLASGKHPRELAALYKDYADKIFPIPFKALRKLKGFFWAKYSDKPLEKALSDILDGSNRLKDLQKKVLVPSFELEGKKNTRRSWKPKFFHNFPGKGSDGLELVVDVALRTSAAPTYFPVYQGYIDGGVVANNPSVAALAQALDPGTGGQKLENIRLFSLGTGESPEWIAGKSQKWGDLQWACHKVFPNLVIDGMMDVADYESRRILNGREDDDPSNHYFRLAPWLPTNIALDDASKVEELIKLAQEVPRDKDSKWRGAVDWLTRNFSGPAGG
jgi:patatin-like phospholipase/acyl hydrolase